MESNTLPEPLADDANTDTWARAEIAFTELYAGQTADHLSRLADLMRAHPAKSMRALRLVSRFTQAAQSVLGELGALGGDFEEVGGNAGDLLPAGYDGLHRIRRGAQRPADQMDVQAAVRAQRLYAAAAALREAREMGDDRLIGRCKAELEIALYAGAPPPLEPPPEPPPAPALVDEDGGAQG